MKSIQVIFLVVFLVLPLKSFTQNLYSNCSIILSGPDSECGNAIVTDNDGNYYVTGYLQNGAQLGGKEINVNGDTDIFIAKYNNKNECLWNKTFGGSIKDPMIANEMGCLIDLDEKGNLIVIGFFSGIAIIDSVSLISNGDDDIFALKLSPTGDLIWSKQFGGKLQDKPIQMEFDSSGLLYILGTYNDQISLDDISLDQDGLSTFVCKIDCNNGKIIEGISTSVIDHFKATNFKFDNKGCIIIAGNSVNNDNASTSIAIMKIDDKGTLKWIKNYSYDGSLEVKSLTLNYQGDIFLIGNFDRKIDLKNFTLHSNGGLDLFFLKLDLSGNIIEKRSYGGAEDEEVVAIINNGVKKVLIGKYFKELIISADECIKTDYSDYFVAVVNNDASMSNAFSLGLTNYQKIFGVNNRDVNTLIFTGLIRNKSLNNEGKDECMKGEVINLIALNHPVSSALQSNYLTISPNPVEKKFNITNLYNTQMWSNVRIVNANGIEQLSFNGNSAEGYDISTLKSGTYIVKVSFINGIVLAIPIIKK